MEGNMRGPSIQDCEKSYARTGVPSWNLMAKMAAESAQQGSSATAPSVKEVLARGGATQSPDAPIPIKWMART